MTDIYIVRHGETAKNRERVLQGRSDVPMNENGIRQVERARDFFRENGIAFDAVYSSPLIRAVRTAEIISGACSEQDHEDGSSGIRIDDQLLEMDYGPYEGCSYMDPPPEIEEFFSDFANNPAPDGVEKLPDLVARMGGFMETLKEKLEEDQTVLIATHAIAMKGILEYLTPASKGAYWSKHVSNCAVYRTTLEDGKYTVPVEVINW